MFWLRSWPSETRTALPLMAKGSEDLVIPLAWPLASISTVRS